MAEAWPAPAKVNLFLHVIGRRPDGFHELQTVFQFLDLADRLRFRLRHDGAILRRSELPGVASEADLVVRAARALQGYTACPRGVEIDVRKALPLGGGLGGGSSDAATTLVALNELWGLHLPAHTLMQIGLRLGADVPVFINGLAAWAEGVGERLTALALDEPWYAVVLPDCTVATGAVFSDPDLTRAGAPIKIRDFLRGERRNDCEPVVRTRYPQVDAALTWLGARGEARLTGTGACVFARYPSAAAARAALGGLPQAWRGYVARGLNRSPLLERLARARGSGA
ncbi:MAG: 4-(cytidine 5'-diphospho)-2-C-methyl-D-erythritol kinase [Gammaproteobacteria bacterium]